MLVHMRRPSVLQGIQAEKDELKPVYGHLVNSSCVRSCDSKNVCMDLEQTRLQESTLQLAAANRIALHLLLL